MRRGLAIVLVAAAACQSFGSPSDDTTGPDGGGGDGGAAGPAYAAGATVTCDQVEGGVCRAPSFCCIAGGTPDTCATTGCDTRDLSKIACRDVTACGAGYVCCVQLDGFHVIAASCEKTCDVGHYAGGSGEFLACSSRAACDGGRCASLQTAIGANVTPDLSVNVCQ